LGGADRANICTILRKKKWAGTAIASSSAFIGLERIKISGNITLRLILNDICKMRNWTNKNKGALKGLEKREEEEDMSFVRLQWGGKNSTKQTKIGSVRRGSKRGL